MYDYGKIESFAMRQIDSIVDKENSTPECVEILGELVDILKDIETIYAMRDYGDNGEYSASYRINPDNPKFINNYRSSGRMYNDMNGTYGHSKEHMMRKLESLMDEATDESQRRAIEDFMQKMSRMS